MKSSAWLVTIIGIVLILPLIGITALEAYKGWIIALAVLIMGITKLMVSYKAKRRR